MKKSKSRKSGRATTTRRKKQSSTTQLSPPSAAPTLTPPAAGTCATCFYGQPTSAISGSPERLCRLNNPSVTPAAPGRWPSVLDDDWCGEGRDKDSYNSFSPIVMDQTSGAAEPVWIAPNPNPGGTLSHLVGSAGGSSTLIRSGAGWVTGISVNSVATGSATMTCYDGIDATGIVIAVIDVSRSNPSPQTAAPWGFHNGFFVVFSNGTTGADVTIVSHSV